MAEKIKEENLSYGVSSKIQFGGKKKERVTLLIGFNASYVPQLQQSKVIRSQRFSFHIVWRMILKIFEEKCFTGTENILVFIKI